MTYLYFIGIDVSNNFFDVVLHDNSSTKAAKAKRFQNSSAGFAALATEFADTLPQSLVVLEATGGYETALLSYLCEAGVSVHRIQPLQARNYMRSLRNFAKTDAIDAAALARYGAERHANLSLFVPADKAHQKLKDLQTRRDDLLAIRTAERQRSKHPRYTNMKKSLTNICTALDAELMAIDAEIEELIASNTLLQKKKAVLKEVKSVGDTTANCLLACLPELGTLTRKQVASLAGLAPHPKDSGNQVGYRAVRGGRHAVRRALYMATLSGIRYNPQIKTFYERLLEQGKKPIVALTAAMRKMIVILNAKIRDACYPEFCFKTW